MATTSSSGLVKNTDFSAELLLNKIMNNEYRANSGKTLTIGGRMNAAKLDADAQLFGIDAENVAKNVAIADATQDALEEILSLAQKAQSAAKLTDTAAQVALGTEYKNQLAELLKATVNGVSILNTTQTAGLGLGAGQITLGLEMSANDGYKALTSALSAISAGTGSSAVSVLESAVNQLISTVAVHGSKAALLSNRYDALNDMATAYKDASDAQAVNTGGNATSLLNSLL
ncbi:MAG: hypothetical protein IJU79_04660 [Desulfovibrionaceae bacterium]|nr:hypothetical protein [Desulfovibrionaceae bacterium]